MIGTNWCRARDQSRTIRARFSAGEDIDKSPDLKDALLVQKRREDRKVVLRGTRDLGENSIGRLQGRVQTKVGQDRPSVRTPSGIVAATYTCFSGSAKHRVLSVDQMRNKTQPERSSGLAHRVAK